MEYVAQVWMETITCYKCAVHFAMPNDLNQKRLKDQESFWCPNGHQQHYTGQTPEAKLKKELARSQEMLDAERARLSRVQRERDDVTKAHRRMRTRVMNGVCPCCNRTFQNLLNHMRTEHKGEFSLKNIRTAYGMTQTQLAKEIGVSPAYISLQESGKEPPAWAKQQIEAWIDVQDKTKV